MTMNVPGIIRFLVALTVIAMLWRVQAYPASLENEYVSLEVAPNQGGLVRSMVLRVADAEFVAPEGLLLEGFGVGSHYVPNRRLNESHETVRTPAGAEALAFSYDCEGPNIQGLRATRTIELLPNEAAMRVRWRLDHQGEEEQWVAPWVQNAFSPGNPEDGPNRWDAPTPQGVINPADPGVFPAARNWIAATNPASRETAYAVFDMDQAFSFHVNPADTTASAQTVFVPGVIRPGDHWETVYRVNLVRGLKHIDFATDELAAQLDFESDALVLRLASPRALPEMRIEATVVGSGGQSWDLPAKLFELNPNRVIRCTYEWTAPEPGTYVFLAQLTAGGRSFELGQDTGSPHGGIDIQFQAGDSSDTVMEPWSDAPYQLERGSRTLQRALAHDGPVSAWFESPLNKIFKNDIPEAKGAPEPVGRMALARNESESKQLVFHAPEDKPLRGLTIRPGRFMHKQTGEALANPDGEPAVRLYNVGYYPVRIPSHYEGPTGEWPDALIPHVPMTVPSGETRPIWITVQAPEDAEPGVYTSLLEIVSPDLPPTELWVEIEVFGFTLPETPRLKSDFGFRVDGAYSRCRARGYNGSRSELISAYFDNAARHRVTLRDIAALPPESPGYQASLDEYAGVLPRLKPGGASTLYTPASLLEVPAQLEQANAFVVAEGLEDRAFTHLAHEPPRPAWPRIISQLNEWNRLAPDITPMTSTFGLEPFLPEEAGIWAVHLPLLDTANNAPVLRRVEAGDPVWLYVNHAPSRPYGNFFIDFAATEHRILFWQAWALGFDGMHYSAINAAPNGADPYQNQLDITPANGNGFLVYPGAEGPVDSIRWETIRDGMDDFDYLTILSERIRAVKSRGSHQQALDRAENARNLQQLVPNLVQFSREAGVLEGKRHEIAESIVELGEILDEDGN